jgi:hypothetical protein
LPLAFSKPSAYLLDLLRYKNKEANGARMAHDDGRGRHEELAARVNGGAMHELLIARPHVLPPPTSGDHLPEL